MSKKVLSGLLILGVLSATGCSLFQNEEQSFIDANIEATCLLAELDLNDMSDNNSQKINDIYSKYGFPVEDETELLQFMAKYENNQEVKDSIEKGSAECRKNLVEKLMNTPEIKDEVEIISPEGTGEVSTVE